MAIEKKKESGGGAIRIALDPFPTCRVYMGENSIAVGPSRSLQALLFFFLVCGYDFLVPARALSRAAFSFPACLACQFSARPLCKLGKIRPQGDNREATDTRQTVSTRPMRQFSEKTGSRRSFVAGLSPSLGVHDTFFIPEKTAAQSRTTRDIILCARGHFALPAVDCALPFPHPSWPSFGEREGVGREHKEPHTVARRRR